EDPRHIADRPQALARAQVLIDRHAAAVRVDADGLQPDALHARGAAGRDEQLVPPPLAGLVERDDLVLAVPPHARRADAQLELDAVAAQDLAERLAERSGLAGQHALGALDQHDLAAEGADDLRELNADRSSAEDQQPLRHGLHAGGLAVGPDPADL